MSTENEKNEYLLSIPADLPGDELVVPIAVRALGTVGLSGLSIYSVFNASTPRDAAVTLAAGLAAYFCAKAYSRLNEQYRSTINSQKFEGRANVQLNWRNLNSAPD